MTREEVMALTDEELRIRAAESLGLRVSVAADGGVSELGDGKTRHYRDAVIPDYPHDIAAAWELFELLRERRLEPSLNAFDPGGDVEIEVWARSDKEFPGLLFAQGDTAPLAITRAFVLAISSQERKEADGRLT